MDFIKFPFEKLNKDSKVVVYGATEIGRALVKLIEKRKIGQIAFLIDRNHESIGFVQKYIVYPVEYINELNDKYVDFYVIGSTYWKDEMINALIKRGVDPKKILALDFIPLDDCISNYGYITYNEDGICSTHNCDFIEDNHFNISYKLGKMTGSWGEMDIRWRTYIYCWAANHVKNLEGDYIECGVNKGGYSIAAINFMNFKNIPKKFFLLDTFKGLVKEQLSNKEKELGIGNLHYEDCYSEVKQTFEKYNNVIIIQGVVPFTLEKVSTDKVCFLSIDMNCVEPEIAAVEYFWDKMISGAVILLDDYGWEMHIEQKKAFDKFAFEKGIQILSLPTGQGLIFKP